MRLLKGNRPGLPRTVSKILCRSMDRKPPAESMAYSALWIRFILYLLSLDQFRAFLVGFTVP